MNIPTNSTNAAPTWIRLPKQGTNCPHTGLKRGQLLKLASDKRNGIRFVHLREPGAKRGTRLIDLKGLLTYLDHCAQGGEASSEKGAA